MNYNNYTGTGAKNNNNQYSPNHANPIAGKHAKGVIDNVSGIQNTQFHNTTNKLYGGYKQNYIRPHSFIDTQEIYGLINEALNEKEATNEIFYSIHNIFLNKLNCLYSACGIYNPTTKCINVKLIDKIGSVYTTRIMEDETDNPIMQVFQNGNYKIRDNNSFLNIPYLIESNIGIFPLRAMGEIIGVYLVGDALVEPHASIYDLMAKYIALAMNNNKLKSNSSQSAQYDALTNLASHSKFQEILSKEIEKTKENNEELSVVIIDVNNTSKINKEFGHAKGDEIIKTVAQKVTNNIKDPELAGRYGGDEIAIILPKTDLEEAKYVAEYISYALSCCTVDEIGPIKVSIGISTYPKCSTDQEKLLIAAEQALYISMDKGYENGIPAIISAEDYDFWDDMAINSFASILAKRHNQLGVNFDDELLNKFNSEEIKSQNQLIEIVTSLASAIDAKDTYTKGHSTSVSRYAEALARSINLPEKEVERIKLGALLHDVGKIGIPENVLRKPSGLTNEEWEVMKQHPLIGAEKVLAPNPALHDLIPIAKYHHEHWDGTGYPEQLKGEEIPLAARIVAVADSYHALISDRPYRKGLGVKKACEILQLGAGIQWDRELVRNFIAIAPSLSVNH